MFLTKYNPLKELSELERRLVNSFPSLNEQNDLLGFTPVVNTREGEFAYHIEADLPGVEKEDIKVEIHDNILTISGERRHKEEVKKEDYYKLESSYGKFERSFSLPKGVDTENIQAASKKGVLEITVPKLQSETQNNKKIEVS
jgi:HSP20 family protein